MDNFSDEEILEFIEKMKLPHTGWEEDKRKMVMLATNREINLADKCVELGFMKKFSDVCPNDKRINWSYIWIVL